MAQPAYDSVLLIGFGGPTEPGQAYAFVKGVVGDRPGTEARIRQVAGHYDHLGGTSPFNDLTRAQGDALAAALRARGHDLPVYMGMRYWHPYVRDVLAAMHSKDRRHALGVILSPLACRLSWDRYQETVAEGQATLEGAAPQVSYIDPWHTADGFLDAIAERVRAAYAGTADDARLIFTAHSIPINGCSECREGQRTCTYAEQFAAAAAAVARRVGRDAHVLAYQSRAAFSQPWLEPDIKDVLREQQQEGVRAVVVAPIGFLCDHIEVLYDLDHDAHATAQQCGIQYARAGTVGTHPAFIGMLADLVAARRAGVTA